LVASPDLFDSGEEHPIEVDAKLSASHKFQLDRAEASKAPAPYG